MLIPRYFVTEARGNQTTLKIYIGDPEGNDFKLIETKIVEDGVDPADEILGNMVRDDVKEKVKGRFKTVFSKKLKRVNKLTEKQVIDFLMDEGAYAPRVIKSSKNR